VIPEAERILRGKAFAHVALCDEQGTPHVSPVWVDVDDDDRIVFNTAEGRVKARLLQMGSRVAISVCDAENPYHYVLVRGTVVERTHEGADDMIDALCRKYHDGRAWSEKPGEQRVTIRVAADHVSIPQ